MRHIQSNGDPSQGTASERTPAQFCCPHCKGVIALGGGLTKSQRKVLTFVAAFIAEAEYSPSLDEISKALSFKSKSQAWQVVEQLCAKGFLAKLGPSTRSRALIVTTPGRVDE